MFLSTLAFMSGVSNAAVTLAGLPRRAMAKRILETSLHGVPGHTEVNPATVAAHFAPDISGADIREIVGRTVLLHGEVTEADLISTVR